jgi:hypothetical protein
LFKGVSNPVNEKEKHMVFHELKDALSRGDCPICFLAERSVARHIDGLFHEMVNDVGVAAELKRSGGFCEKHSEQILKTSETLGIAIIYKRLLDVFIGLLQKVIVIPKLALCPLCGTYSEAEHRYLHALLDHWDELKESFISTSILCVNHTQNALAAAGKRSKIKNELLDIQIKKLSELSAELEELCRKYDYRFNDEKWGKEKDAWQRAVKLMSVVPKRWRD